MGYSTVLVRYGNWTVGAKTSQLDQPIQNCFDAAPNDQQLDRREVEGGAEMAIQRRPPISQRSDNAQSVKGVRSRPWGLQPCRLRRGMASIEA